MQPATLAVEPEALVLPAEEDEVQRIKARAEEQAAGDLALLQALQERDAARPPKPEGEEQEEFVVQQQRMPMNRAERRQQVALYSRILAETERQVPVVNPTIIPKSKRRRRRA